MLFLKKVMLKLSVMKSACMNFLLLCAVFLFSSFGGKKSMGGVVKNSGSSTQMFAFPLCSGDYVEMTLTDNYVIHGIVNSNRAMVDIEHHFTGRGVSILTGQIYTMDTRIESHANVPVKKGAMVIQEIISDDLSGDEGGLQAVLIRSHQTFNANGNLTADRYVVQPNCR
jgi:hypothetical protein